MYVNTPMMRKLINILVELRAEMDSDWFTIDRFWQNSFAPKSKYGAACKIGYEEPAISNV